MTELNLTVSELARRIGGQVVGAGGVVISGIAPLSSAGGSDVSFLADDQHSAELADTKAGAVIVGADRPSTKIPLICVDNVMSAVAAVLEMSAGPGDFPQSGVHPTAVVAEDAEIADGAAVGPGVVVGSGAKIAAGAVLCANVTVEADAAVGEETILYPGTVVISGCRIGRRCRIGPCAVIGSSGFGYYFAEGRHNPIPHIGTVEIGDDVDIGACSCVDRGKFGATRIGDGTKIDNLVQVAHNVQIGRGCILVGQAGIAGSSVLKDYVAIGGQAGVNDNVTVGTGVKVAGGSAIFKDVPDGAEVAGFPAIQASRQLRVWNIITELPELRKKVRQMEKRLTELESADHKNRG